MNIINPKPAWASTDRAMLVVGGLALALIVMLSPEMAAAQTAIETLEPLEAIIESIIGIMTGPIATGRMIYQEREATGLPIANHVR